MIGKCSYKDCNNKGVWTGPPILCGGHRKQQKKGKELSTLRKVDRRIDKSTSICSFESCGYPTVAWNLCRAHHTQAKNNFELKPIKRRIRKRGTGQITRYGYLKIAGKFEHRRVMEEFLDRELTKDETVHHKNGDKLDNRIENLELWSTGHPSGQRVEDKIKWAEEYLQKYAPEKLK